MALDIVFRFPESELRIAAACAVAVLAVATALFSSRMRRSPLPLAALALGTVATIAFSAAWLEPDASGTQLNYLIHAMAAVALIAAIYGIGFTKLVRTTNLWTRAVYRLVPVLVVLDAATIMAVLSVEAIDYVQLGVVAIAWPGIIVVALTLAGISVAAIVAAVVPGRDPLKLPERSRGVYVYVAEVVLGLLFLHVRLTMPWLFRGFFQQYWPLIIVSIAFVGVGISEVFRRQKRFVLAEPLERTGAFLPLLPILGHWALPNLVHFSFLMVAIAGVYLAISVLRKSFLFGLVAAVAANTGLWYLLMHTETLGLLQHPQLWFIPPALCVLLASYLNRDELSESQMTSIRYFMATIIYVSSTADIFLNGVANAPWLPLVLGALSIIGILAGILLRVRGFLFLGSAFLMMSLLTIIWHAAVDLEQTWIWSVSGIITGILLIAMFAVFEKKRQDILKVIDQLKAWDA